MEWTPFAGLTALDENDAITVDGSTFLTKNPWIIDRLLRVGALTHRHNAHAALPNPTHAMVGVVSALGGALPPNEDFAVTYTVIDNEGGETLAAPGVVLTTGVGIGEPTIAPSAVASYASGIMPAGTYYYALTYTDGAGGETVIGPSTSVSLDPGFASGSVILSGLATELVSGGGTAITYRLWRSYEGEDWHLLAESTLDDFTDAGFDPPDNPALPPAQDTISGSYQLQVTLPTAGDEPAIASGQAIRIYLAPDTGFAEPCFYEQVPLASAGSTIAITSATIATGSPPRVSTALQGAHKIDPDTELLDFPWKRPVATAADLPSVGNEAGDVRLTLDDYALHAWNGGTDTWDTLGGGGVSTTAARAYVNTPSTPAALWQKLLLDTVSFDTDSGFDLANSRYVVPADGLYMVNGNVLTASSASGGVAIYKNGAVASKGTSGPTPTGWAGFQVGDIIECTAGDLLELWGYFSGADPLDIEAGATNYLSIVKM